VHWEEILGIARVAEAQAQPMAPLHHVDLSAACRDWQQRRESRASAGLLVLAPFGFN
jgi:hypothetical protein